MPVEWSAVGPVDPDGVLLLSGFQSLSSSVDCIRIPKSGATLPKSIGAKSHVIFPLQEITE